MGAQPFEVRLGYSRLLCRGGGDRLQLDHRPAATGDDDALTLEGAVDQLRELVFRFGDAVGAHRRKIVDQTLRGQSSRHRKSGPSSLRVGQPIWPITRSISPRNMSIAFLTPGSPPATAPYRVGRPKKQNCVPRQSAIRMSAPRRTPLSSITVMRSPTAALIAGSASSEPGAWSSWRPPWLETMTPSQPISAARTASAGLRMPFTTRARGN